MRTFSSFLMALALMTPVFAADLPSSAAPQAPALSPYDWTGAYVGAQFATYWGQSSNEVTAIRSGAFLGSGVGRTVIFNGGGQIGYDYMTLSRIVFGISASLAAGNRYSDSVSTPTGTYAFRYDYSDSWSGSVRGRIGYAFGDTLPYATTGWSWSANKVARTQLVGQSGIATPGTTDEVNSKRNGWSVGAGLAHHLLGNWIVFAQYDYTKFAPINVAFAQARYVVLANQSANTVTCGVNYKF